MENVSKGQLGPLIRSGRRGAECAPRAARRREQLSEEASQRRCAGPAREEGCWALQTRADNEAVSGKSVCFSQDQAAWGGEVSWRAGVSRGPSAALSRGTALHTAPYQPRSLCFLYTFANPGLKLLSSHDATSPECEFFWSKDHGRNGAVSSAKGIHTMTFLETGNEKKCQGSRSSRELKKKDDTDSEYENLINF